jgi:methylenetetrahydrofolate reductase (NADPH)
MIKLYIRICCGPTREDDMKIVDILKEKKQGVSFEFFPPKSAEGKDTFMHVVHDLRKHNPLYVSVTCGAGGSTRDRTLDTLKCIKADTDLTVMAHTTCIGATRNSMDELLKEYIANGIDNVLALRGDPPRNVPDFDLTKGEFQYARDLVEFIRPYTAFSVGVAVYPEGHVESPDIDKDLEYTKQKIDAGADFGVTQMFFDNRFFYDFMDRAEKIGINIPIFPGIMPVTDCRKIEEFAAFCNATVPTELRKSMEPYLDSPEEMRMLGVEYAVKQCQDLIANGFGYLHFYTMNKTESVNEILEALRNTEKLVG